ncbi:hypothetical protein [Krasilnikovia sp. MM14-A1259]|uniref:hypothetical protein n=1 Tax=Krasilnikovia sp. MM14-A1259 TaxID=3373539 RepID=UPI00382B59FE
MGIHWWWYAETLVDGDWKLWPERTAAEVGRPRELLFVSGRRRVMDLFVGPQPLFSMNTELPTQPPDSEYLGYAQQHHDDEYGPTYWCDFEDLLVEEWTTCRILVTAEVPAWQAPLFTDGASAFPERALREAGLSRPDVDQLRDGRPTGTGIDRTWGRAPRNMDAVERVRAVPVTWSDTVAGLFGQHALAAFEFLRSRPGDRRRVFVRRG